jgi:hypothetical protein
VIVLFIIREDPKETGRKYRLYLQQKAEREALARSEEITCTPEEKPNDGRGESEEIKEKGDVVQQLNRLVEMKEKVIFIHSFIFFSIVVDLQLLIFLTIYHLLKGFLSESEFIMAKKHLLSSL